MGMRVIYFQFPYAELFWQGFCIHHTWTLWEPLVYLQQWEEEMMKGLIKSWPLSWLTSSPEWDFNSFFPFYTNTCTSPSLCYYLYETLPLRILLQHVHSLSARQVMTVVVLVVILKARDWKAVISMHLPPCLWNKTSIASVTLLGGRRWSSFECNHVASLRCDKIFANTSTEQCTTCSQIHVCIL